MDCQTILLSASRYLESQYDIYIDGEAIESLMLLRSYAKKLNDDTVSYYWEEFKKEYPNHQVHYAKMVKEYVDSSLNFPIEKNVFSDAQSIDLNRLSSLDDMSKWLNKDDNSFMNSFIRLPEMT